MGCNQSVESPAVEAKKADIKDLGKLNVNAKETHSGKHEWEIVELNETVILKKVHEHDLK